MKYMLVAALASFLLSELDNLKPKENVDKEYDFIIVGSGPSGCVIANRLSANLYSKVLLVEAGDIDTEEPRISVPNQAPTLIGSAVDWMYESVPNNHFRTIANKSYSIPRGKVLGGTSSINYQMYIRGSPHDFNRWEDLGAKDWGWKDVEPYFQQVERATTNGMSKRLGKHGYLKLRTNKDDQLPQFDTFYQAAKEIGIEETDYTDNMEGISLVTSSVHNGIRQNGATAYLRQVISERKERLHVVVGAHATKILTSVDDEGKPKAYGIQYRKRGELVEVHARKEVILCGGFIGSPQLLLLSGIGPKKQLQDLDIDVVADLPGVGGNLQDHVYFIHVFNKTKRPNKDETENKVSDYIVNGRGRNPNSLVLHYKTSYSGTNTSSSSKERPTPEIQIFLGNTFPQPEDTTFITTVNLMQAKSRGTLRLRSKNAEDYPIIDLNYYGDADDYLVHIEGFRLMEKLENSQAFKDFGAELMLPNVCNASKNSNIPRTDEYYRCLIEHRTVVGTHECCTAKIGSVNDRYAVVDSELRVYGVSHLRIADASVMPHVTSANTQAPCYMIGEKAADMIKKSWSLK